MIENAASTTSSTTNRALNRPDLDHTVDWPPTVGTMASRDAADPEILNKLQIDAGFLSDSSMSAAARIVATNPNSVTGGYLMGAEASTETPAAPTKLNRSSAEMDVDSSPALASDTTLQMDAEDSLAQTSAAPTSDIAARTAAPPAEMDAVAEQAQEQEAVPAADAEMPQLKGDEAPPPLIASPRQPSQESSERNRPSSANDDVGSEREEEADFTVDHHEVAPPGEASVAAADEEPEHIAFTAQDCWDIYSLLLFLLCIICILEI